VKKIVDDHGGEIRLANNHGGEVNIWLPLAAMDAARESREMPKILVSTTKSEYASCSRRFCAMRVTNVQLAEDAAAARAAREAGVPTWSARHWMPDTDGITLLKEWAGNASSICRW